VRRRSCGARPACPADRFTAYQTTFAVTPEGCTIPPFTAALPLLGLIPIASSGLSQPLSADSSASLRIADKIARCLISHPTTCL